MLSKGKTIRLEDGWEHPPDDSTLGDLDLRATLWEVGSGQRNKVCIRECVRHVSVGRKRGGRL